jgi:hypothetical protein
MRATTPNYAERHAIVTYLNRYYSDRDPSRIRIARDGSVTVRLSPAPNTDKPATIFAGWVCDLLADAAADQDCRADAAEYDAAATR